MKIIVYRILSFLLLPIAVLFSISCLLLITTAFANPTMLLPLFIIVCVVIYSFASLNFLLKGIDRQKFLGKSAKDWLRVNAIVSAIFAVLMISQCTIVIMHPEMLHSIIAQAKLNAGSQLKLNSDEIVQYMRNCCYIFLVYAIILFVHVLFSFQLMRSYSFLFQHQDQQ